MNQQVDVDLSKCPKCKGVADNGHDRCSPPNPYYCTKCSAEPDDDDSIDKEARMKSLDELTAEAQRLGFYELVATVGGGLGSQLHEAGGTFNSPAVPAYKEGDIFTWRWKESSPRHEQCKGTGTLYWCMSQICVADSAGRLFDTYWHGGDNRLVNPDECDLEYVANRADLVKIEPYQRGYYADKDIVNLNHANSSSGNLYIRNGAAKCALKMLQTLNEDKERHVFEINYSRRKIEKINQQIALIESGKIDEVYL